MLRPLRIITYVVIIIVTFFPHYSSGQFINGDFSSGLLGWNTFGDVTAEEGAAILRTGGIDGAYVTSLSTTFIVTGDRLNFEYYFDITGPDDILSPDFPSYPPHSFQITLYAGNDDYLVDPISLEPEDVFTPFSLDISLLEPGTIVTLSFDLVDQDDGYRSVAAIDDVTDPPGTVPEPGTLILLGSGLMGIFVINRYRSNFMRRLLMTVLFAVMIFGNGVAHGELLEENVDGMTRLDFTAPVFNTRTNTLTLNMAVTNISDISIHTPLKVIITSISTQDVTLANPDGYTQEGLPYFDLTRYIADQELSPGESASPVKVSFYNPKRVKFRWDQDVLAFVEVNTQKGPVLENICFVPGEFPPLCEFNLYDFEVEDPEFDNLLQRQLPEMYRYEQVRVYAYDHEELPVSITINDTDAFYDEEGFYYYSDLVLVEGLNTISIDVTNESGISISRDISLSIDTRPPNIEILQPVNASVVTSKEIIITGIIDDPAVVKVSLIKDFMSREDIPVSAGQFEASISLSPGHNNITIEAADLPGNSTTKNIDIVYAYSATGEVSGRILNSVLGLPVAGAVITSISQNVTDMTVISDEAGGYRIEEVNSGDVTLLVEKDGYEPKSITICALGGISPAVHDITLQPVTLPGTFTLMGQVKKRDGFPLSGVKISITGSSLNTISDSNGLYIISGIPRSSFGADAIRDGFKVAIVNVNAGVYSSDTTILTHNFILDEISYGIVISYPENGGYTSGEKTMVRGFIRNGDRDVGVRVNSVLANVYNGYFVANSVPLSGGMNIITAEMIDETGTIVTDSIELSGYQMSDGYPPLIHAQEAGIVPVKLTVVIEGPPGIFFTDSNVAISGTSATQLLSEGPLHYTVLINEPGIYSITFSGVDSYGNSYIEEFGFTGMVKGDVDSMLRQKWIKFKNLLVNNSTGDALSMITPETRARYENQFLMAGAGLSDFFSGIGDIQLVTLSDNMAKARVYRDDVTHYVWFARDIYGLWKINKF